MPQRRLTVDEVARVIPALERCPHHPNAIILPFYGFRSCCLLAALQAIRSGTVDPIELTGCLLAGAPGRLPKFPLPE